MKLTEEQVQELVAAVRNAFDAWHSRDDDVLERAVEAGYELLARLGLELEEEPETANDEPPYDDRTVPNDWDPIRYE